MPHRRVTVEAQERNLCQRMLARSSSLTPPAVEVPTDPKERAAAEFGRVYHEVVVGSQAVTTRELLARSA
jgi:hypothetical protein